MSICGSFGEKIDLAITLHLSLYKVVPNTVEDLLVLDIAIQVDQVVPVFVRFINEYMSSRMCLHTYHDYR